MDRQPPGQPQTAVCINANTLVGRSLRSEARPADHRRERQAYDQGHVEMSVGWSIVASKFSRPPTWVPGLRAHLATLRSGLVYSTKRLNRSGFNSSWNQKIQKHNKFLANLKPLLFLLLLWASRKPGSSSHRAINVGGYHLGGVVADLPSPPLKRRA